MKRTKVIVITALLLFAATAVFAQSGGKIAFVSATADGQWDSGEQSGVMTKFIELQLSGTGTDDLDRDDITITPGTAIVTRRFVLQDNGDGNFTLYFDNVPQSQVVTVTIDMEGYTINPPSRQVTIYSGKGPAQ
jgi:hypothetical protein